ncbi:MAG: hypothetical protein A2010_15595 [Nitrospirae bacterium GWD2_57_9]|nr:MAG: hypothetical protein A2010_15595 [Nitrospirae bacterium GWD2_57_9]OGW48127.1 MAG: hypothetical protein A2078_00680 [Nitrospirae bacterium GWC2_57_9]
MTASAAVSSPTEKNINVGQTERWISMAAGAALAIYGLTRESMASKASFSILGGYLFYRGQTGHDLLYDALGVNTMKAGGSVNIERTITINRSPEEVYRFWHNFENLPRFMEHLESVKVYDDRRSHWVANVPGGINFEWDAEMTEDVPNERISWRSYPNADVQNEGTVEFRRVPGGGTRLLFKASYAIPGIEAGATSKMFRFLTEKQLEKELTQFKNLIESREIAASRV